MRKFLAALLFTSTLIVAQQVPHRAPGFCLSDSTGQWRDLADYRGKPVIVEFMQTTCPHCAAFAPILEKAKQTYGNRIAILAIAISPDTPAAIMQYVSGHKVTYPVLLDMGQVAASYVRSPQVTFPTIYLVDAEGMIFDHFTYGPMTRDIFEGNGLTKEVERMLNHSSVRNKK